MAAEAAGASVAAETPRDTSVPSADVAASGPLPKSSAGAKPIPPSTARAGATDTPRGNAAPDPERTASLTSEAGTTTPQAPTMARSPWAAPGARGAAVRGGARPRSLGAETSSAAALTAPAPRRGSCI